MDCDKSVDWKTANRRTGGAFIPGETIVKLIKLHYWKRIWVRDNPSGFTFQSRGERVHARTCWLRLSQTNTTSKENVAPGFYPGRGGVNPTVALHRVIETGTLHLTALKTYQVAAAAIMTLARLPNGLRSSGRQPVEIANEQFAAPAR